MSRRIDTDFPVLACLVAVAITTFPALRKVLWYPGCVARFDVWGVPWPEVVVLVAGTVQLFALATIVLGVSGRLGASVLVVVMIVAMATAGVNPLKGAVFVAAVVIVLLDTGRYSVWDPPMSTMRRFVRGAPTGGG